MTALSQRLRDGLNRFQYALSGDFRDAIKEASDIEALVQNDQFVADFLSALADRIHADNVEAGWWTDIKTGEDLHGKRNVPEMLCLIHSEISEGMEGHRKKLMDDKLPHRPMLRVEMADAVIRILDLMGSQDNDEHPFGTLLQEKRNFNRHRADHKVENRLKDGGKAF